MANPAVAGAGSNKNTGPGTWYLTFASHSLHKLLEAKFQRQDRVLTEDQKPIIINTSSNGSMYYYFIIRPRLPYRVRRIWARTVFKTFVLEL